MGGPEASSEKVRRQMVSQRTTGTAAELALRSELHRRGLRYRVDYPPVPGLRRKGDIVFTRARVVVMVDGCFWHRCPEHATYPKANAEWWESKLARNVERDRETDRFLSEAGWTVVRVWEHEDVQVVAAQIESVLDSRRRLES